METTTCATSVTVPLLEGLATTSVGPEARRRSLDTESDGSLDKPWAATCQRRVRKSLRRAWSQKAFRKLVVFVIFVPLAVAVQVLFTRTGKKLGRRYMMMFQQTASIGYLVCILPCLWYLSSRTRTVTSRVRRTKKGKFVLMGFLDCLSTYCVYHGVNGTSLTAQTVFTQAQLPLMVILSLIVLKKRFLLWQYLGAFFILCGIVVCFLSQYKTMSEDVHNPQAHVWLMVVFLLSAVPGTLSSIYKDWSFQKNSMNVLYLTGWVTIFNVMWGFVLSPLGALPIFGEIDSIYDVPMMYKEGAYCLIGSSGRPGDHCNKPWQNILVLILLRVLYSFSFLAIVKHGGIRLMVWSMITVTVLTNLIATQPWAMSNLAYTLSTYDYCAVGLVVLGLLVYGITKPMLSDDQGVGDVGMSTVVLESHLSGMKRAFGGRTQGGDQIQSRSNVAIRNAYFMRLGIPIQAPNYQQISARAAIEDDDNDECTLVSVNVQK